MMKHTMKSVGLGLLLLASSALQAQIQLPYDRTGQLDALDVAGNGIVISDEHYKLGYGIPVYSSNGNLISVGQLAVGQSVGYSTQGATPATVTGIWVLKAGGGNVE